MSPSGAHSSWGVGYRLPWVEVDPAVWLFVGPELEGLRIPGGCVPGFVARLGRLCVMSALEVTLGVLVSIMPRGWSRWSLPRFVVCRGQCELVGEGRCHR